MIKRICVIADGYPSDKRVVNAFVENLINEFVDKGIECTVICPKSINNVIKNRDFVEYRRTRVTTKGNSVTVYTPKFVSASVRKIGPINTAKITAENFKKAAARTFKKLFVKEKFDAIYAHFIFPSAITANYLSKKYNIPAFFAYGENGTYSIDRLGDAETQKRLDNISGIIAVSSENKNVLIKHSIASESKIIVAPNSINSSLFYKKDKFEARKKLGFPLDDFIVGFVGRMLEVKGPLRLSKALEQLDDPNVSCFFIGEGPQIPQYGRILHKGQVQHSELVDFLNAADVFVLPTLAEGCCNAIVEALACGLPVVSANLPFNDDILNDDNSIRVDPNNIDEIARAIACLRDNTQKREQLSGGAIKTSQGLNIDARANKILEFMSSQLMDKE